MKYCKSCGEPYKGEYCEHCGYGKPAEKSKSIVKIEKELAHTGRKQDRITAKKEPRAPETVKKSVRTRNTVLAFLGLAVLTVVITLIVNSGIFTKAEKEEVIENYFTAIQDKDFDKLIDTMTPEMREALVNRREEEGLSKSEYVAESFSDYFSYFGDDMTVKVEFGSKKEITNDNGELDENETAYETTYGKSIDIKSAYKIRAIVDFSGSEATETLKYDVLVAKIKKSWYIMNIEEADDDEDVTASDLDSAEE